MSPAEFILKIITIYHDARVSRYADQKIRRGRSHSISSIAEDLFASYLILNDPTIDLVYVDQPITVPGRLKSFAPDIVIVRNNIITAFLDLKMDLGYKRDGLIALCKKDQELLLLIRGHECAIKDGVTKERKIFSISPSAIYDLVIISGRNISKQKLMTQLEGASVYAGDVKVHVLTDNEHPNTYGVEPGLLLKRIKIHSSAFEDLRHRTQ